MHFRGIELKHIIDCGKQWYWPADQRLVCDTSSHSGGQACQVIYNPTQHVIYCEQTQNSSNFWP